MMLEKRVLVAALLSVLPVVATAQEVLQDNSLSSSSAESFLLLEVIDAYADVHTGPAEAFPVINVIEQGETVQVLTRRPDWYEVRDAGGRHGWISARELSRTLQSTGEPVDLPTVSYGDYLQNRLRIGFNAGQLSKGKLDAADSFGVVAGYRAMDWLAAEIEWGKLFNADVEGDYYHGSLLLEPFSVWRFSPLLIAGYGEMRLQEQPKLTPLLTDNGRYALYGIGANYYLGRNFLIRAEYRWYSFEDSEAMDLESWKIGFNSFF
ncbi:SH3 domain-containing protein [Sinobacterium caligoides]|uniref:SH3 domain-containing protein n=1 Tax=Sinobacterium caligoides TaxID=933926 RepID=A0A3N2DN23_9GAMM|nr:SH3 domain-containing protein [Sinobacterium caligoides]ROS01206.1 SH3 domain-containing protein [Sinobacterium caligoides]